MNINRLQRLTICVALVLATAAGCKLEDPYEDSLDIDVPQSTREALVYLDHGRHQVIFARPTGSDLDLEVRPLGDARTSMLWSETSRNGEQLLVLTGPSDPKHEEVEETLHRFSADGSEVVAAQPVLAPFNKVALTPDHERAVLYFGGDSNELLQNANQVAIAQLQTDDVRNFTLNGFGGRLTDVQFPGQIVDGEPGPIQVGPHERDIAVFLADDELVLVDMANEGADQVAVRFDEAGGFNPSQTLLRPGDDLFADPALFVISDAAGDDLAMLTLIDKPDEVTDEPGFTVQISLIPVGQGASDFIYYDGADVPYLVTARQSLLVFTDIRTHESFEIDMEGHVTHVFLRDHLDEEGDVVTQAVAWAPGAAELHTLALDGIESTLGRKPERHKIETGIDELVVLDNDRVLVGSGTTLYVVDFPEERVTPLTSKSPYDPASTALDGSMLLLGTSGQDWVSSVDLLGLNPESVILDREIDTFHFLPEERLMVVTHADAIGRLTILDADDPSRAGAVEHWGYLLDGIFDL